MAATTIEATYVRPNGDPEVGFVEFSLIVPSYQDTLDKIVTKTPIKVEMDEDGKVTVDLEPTTGDEADFIIEGLSYKVVEKALDDREKVRWSRKYYISVPTSPTPVDLGVLSAWSSAPSPFLARLPYGTTANRPTPELAGIGGHYFDTDLNMPIYSDGAAWLLSDGTAA